MCHEFGSSVDFWIGRALHWDSYFTSNLPLA